MRFGPPQINKTTSFWKRVGSTRPAPGRIRVFFFGRANCTSSPSAFLGVYNQGFFIFNLAPWFCPEFILVPHAAQRFNTWVYCAFDPPSCTCVTIKSLFFVFILNWPHNIDFILILVLFLTFSHF